MSMHRKNKCKGGRYRSMGNAEPWFWPSVHRRRRRTRIARRSKQINRRVSANK